MYLLEIKLLFFYIMSLLQKNQLVLSIMLDIEIILIRFSIIGNASYFLTCLGQEIWGVSDHRKTN